MISRFWSWCFRWPFGDNFVLLHDYLAEVSGHALSLIPEAWQETDGRKSRHIKVGMVVPALFHLYLFLYVLLEINLYGSSIRRG